LSALHAPRKSTRSGVGGTGENELPPKEYTVDVVVRNTDEPAARNALWLTPAFDDAP
jgi:hypothetical protein